MTDEKVTTGSARTDKTDVSAKTIPLVMSLLALGVIGFGVVVSPDLLPSVPVCGFRLITGKPCPACGMTHAVCALGHLRFGDAWHYNPLVYLVFLGCLMVGAAPLIRRWTPRYDALLFRIRSFLGFPMLWLSGLLGFAVYRFFWG